MKKSIWVPIKRGRSKIVGYLERFETASGMAVSLPGISRWIEGPVLDVSKAKVIE